MSFTEFLSFVFISLLSVAVVVPMFNAFFRMFHYSTEEDNELRINFKNYD